MIKCRNYANKVKTPSGRTENYSAYSHMLPALAEHASKTQKPLFRARGRTSEENVITYGFIPEKRLNFPCL